MKRDLSQMRPVLTHPTVKWMLPGLIFSTQLFCSSAQQTSKESRRTKSGDASVTETSSSTGDPKSKGASPAPSPPIVGSAGTNAGSSNPNTPGTKPEVSPRPAPPTPASNTPQAQGAAAFLCRPPINGQALALIQAVKGRDLNSLGIPLDETQRQMLEMVQTIDPSNQAAVQMVQAELDSACPK